MIFLCLRLKRAQKVKLRFNVLFKLGNKINLITSLASILYITGNLYKVGNIFTSIHFYSIEKEYFPVQLKRFYIRSHINKPDLNYLSLQEWKSNESLK